jgi:hypothetical protein
MLKEWQSGFLGCFKIVFDDVIDDLAFTVGHVHGLIKIDATTHVPDHLEDVGPDITGLVLHAFYVPANPSGIKN